MRGVRAKLVDGKKSYGPTKLAKIVIFEVRGPNTMGSTSRFLKTGPPTLNGPSSFNIGLIRVNQKAKIFPLILTV